MGRLIYSLRRREHTRNRHGDTSIKQKLNDFIIIVATKLFLVFDSGTRLDKNYYNWSIHSEFNIDFFNI